MYFIFYFNDNGCPGRRDETEVVLIVEVEFGVEVEFAFEVVPGWVKV